MSGKSMMWIILAVIVVAVGSSTVYYVDEREKAIVFQFGEIVRSNDEPGFHFKAPLINNVKFFDSRVQTMDSDPELYLTREKKNLVVDSFVKWRITNAANYYTRLGGLAQAMPETDWRSGLMTHCGANSATVRSSRSSRVIVSRSWM